MGTASYIVQGKGNAAAINSAPHGAGRLMSRTKARAGFTQDDLRQAMQGIEYRDSADLVDVVHELHQIVNLTTPHG